MAMLLALAGCTFLVDPPHVTSLAWSSDGHVYYEVDSLDWSHHEIWRRDPAGRAAMYPISAPAKVAGDVTCDLSSNMLFTWPDGALGDFFPCNDGDRYYALDPGSGVLTFVATLPFGTGLSRGRIGAGLASRADRPASGSRWSSMAACGGCRDRSTSTAGETTCGRWARVARGTRPEWACSRQPHRAGPIGCSASPHTCRREMR